MSETATPAPGAARLYEALCDAGTTHIVTVPDFVQFALHDRLGAAQGRIVQVFACSEDQALTTATGLYVGGARPAVLVQNQGLYKCLNTLRAACIDAGVPIVFLVGQFGRETENFDQPMRQSRRSMVRMMEPLLDAIGVRYWTVESDDDAGAIAEAFAHAYAAETAAVVLIGRNIVWN